MRSRLILQVLAMVTWVTAEPIVVRGELMQALLGTPVGTIRVTDLYGHPIPFQIDEVVEEGEYVCPLGEEPNTEAGNGVLDSADELVFLSRDASVVDSVPGDDSAVVRDSTGVVLYVTRSGSLRAVRVTSDPSVGLSPVRYVEYDHAVQRVRTDQYTAAFGRDRFHFMQAGIRGGGGDEGYLLLTNELRVEIQLRAFWGLVPISYTEDNLVCLVKRYKAGPVRLIRRGDFHLNLGLGIKGSRAAVNQMCYPDLVCVPVRVHLPVRFRSFFREAYIEMTPVINERGAGYAFNVPSQGISLALDTTTQLDTLVQVVPDNTFFRVDNGTHGYGWLLRSTIERMHLGGSGYVLATPSERGGIGHCGFRLALTDLPRGYYTITNWVVFATGVDELSATYQAIAAPSTIVVPRTGSRASNIL